MHRFKSCAEWEGKHGFYKNTTTDTHDTAEQATAVCRGLEREGLGGEKIHFPLKTWTEELLEVPTPDGFGYVWMAQEGGTQKAPENSHFEGTKNDLSI